MFERIVLAINGVWNFNSHSKPALELALDGQLSNWVLTGPETKRKLYYIDTSTPLYRVDGVEQLDPELLLKSAPGFLRWIIRLLFLKEVMNRYYSPRLVFTDLAANLYKEQRPDLIATAIDAINAGMPAGFAPLCTEEVEKYYREDKMIWSLFLSFRKVDRFITTRLLRRRYEFMLPDSIRR